MNCIIGKKRIVFHLDGRIDSNNSASFEEYLITNQSNNPEKEIILDANNLTYISSAGLRALLKLKKSSGKSVIIINVSDDVYDIFALTGFLEMFEVSKKIKTVELKKTDVLMRSLNGKFHRQSEDKLIKVYDKGVTFEQVSKERDLAKKALVMGVPTLIPFDVCMVEDRFGLMFEASDTYPLSKAISFEPHLLNTYAADFAHFIHELHNINAFSNAFPSIKEKYSELMYSAKNWLKPEDKEQINALFTGIPDAHTYLHGNITIANVVIHDNEMMVVDMASSAYGHPIFDLQNIYSSLIEKEKEKPLYCSSVLGVSPENCQKFWNVFFTAYMDGSTIDAMKSMQSLLKKYYILNQKLLSVLENK